MEKESSKTLDLAQNWRDCQADRISSQ